MFFILLGFLVLFSTTASCSPFIAAKQEPEFRVGIILAEDGDHEVAFRLEPGRSYRLEGSGAAQTFKSDSPTSGNVSLIGGQIQLTLLSTPPISMRGNPIRVSPLEKQALKKDAGILVKNLVAGRIFHWRKRIDQTLLGSLEFHSQVNSIVMVNVVLAEHYLAGVLTGEMSGECPLEFMKSQVVAARTFSYPGGKHGSLYSYCNDDCCQRYQGTGDLSERAIRTIEETRGEVILTPSGSLSGATYSKSCGGIMSDPRLVWGSSSPTMRSTLDGPENSEAKRFFPVTEENAREYLTGDWVNTTDIFCSANVVPEGELPRYLGRVDEAQKYFRWRVEYTRQELEELLRSKGNLNNLATLTGLSPDERGPSGRIHALRVKYKDTSGGSQETVIANQYRIRLVLHPSFLFSSAFVIDTEMGQDGIPSKYIFLGGGWGHGVGMCQIGALGMGLKGYTYRQILDHYYKGCRIEKAYP